MASPSCLGTVPTPVACAKAAGAAWALTVRGSPLSLGPYLCGGRVCRVPPAWGWHRVQGESCVLSYSKNENDSKIWAFPGALGIYQGLACGQAALGCPHGCPWGTGPLATPGQVTPCAVFAGSAARTQRGKVAGAW